MTKSQKQLAEKTRIGNQGQRAGMVATYWAARDSSEIHFQIDKRPESGFISLADFLGGKCKPGEDNKGLVVDITEEF